MKITFLEMNFIFLTRHRCRSSSVWYLSPSDPYRFRNQSVDDNKFHDSVEMSHCFLFLISGHTDGDCWWYIFSTRCTLFTFNSFAWQLIKMSLSTTAQFSWRGVTSFVSLVDSTYNLSRHILLFWQIQLMNEQGWHSWEFSFALREMQIEPKKKLNFFLVDFKDKQQVSIAIMKWEVRKKIKSCAKKTVLKYLEVSS